MVGKFVIIIIFSILIILIAIILITVSYQTGGELTHISNTVTDEARKISDLNDRFLDVFSPYADVTTEGLTEFVSKFTADRCGLKIVTICDINSPLYNRGMCLPTCEYISSIRGLCQADEDLRDNAICQLIP